MRRREKSLGQCLAAGDSAPRRPSGISGIDFVHRIFRVTRLRPKVGSLVTELEGEGIRSLEGVDLTLEMPEIKDGLQGLESGTQPAPEPAGIRDVHLKHDPQVCDLGTGFSTGLAVHRMTMILTTTVQDFDPAPPNPRIRIQPLLSGEFLRPVQRGRGLFENRGPSVRSGIAEIRVLPHIRRCADLDTLSRGELEEYLQEAERRGLAGGTADLLALFRRIPIELIAQVRFLEQDGMLLYTLEPDFKPRQTRVHDMAAVRNRSTGTVHLIAHRTRSRTAVLRW